MQGTSYSRRYQSSCHSKFSDHHQCIIEKEAITQHCRFIPTYGQTNVHMFAWGRLPGHIGTQMLSLPPNLRWPAINVKNKKSKRVNSSNPCLLKESHGIPSLEVRIAFSFSRTRICCQDWTQTNEPTRLMQVTHFYNGVFMTLLYRLRTSFLLISQLTFQGFTKFLRRPRVYIIRRNVMSSASGWTVFGYVVYIYIKYVRMKKLHSSTNWWKINSVQQFFSLWLRHY